MKHSKSKCPTCGFDSEDVCDEIDIGVGLMTHFLYCECPNCGPWVPPINPEWGKLGPEHDM